MVVWECEGKGHNADAGVYTADVTSFYLIKTVAARCSTVIPFVIFQPFLYIRIRTEQLSIILLCKELRIFRKL